MANLNQDTMAKIIARAWKDENFKQKLLKNPKEALKEFNVELSNNVNFNVVESSNTNLYLVIPSAPSNAKQLSEAELRETAAASGDPLGCTVHCDSKAPYNCPW